ILVGAVVHLLVLILVGGDWMPFYRLATPVLPGLAYVAAELARNSPPWILALRGAAQAVVAGMLFTALGPSARNVFEQRLALIEAIEPELVGARRIAALDIGWLSAATSASVFDAAGVTDPSVARLPGGHTTKRLPEGWLEQHRIDSLVLLADAPDPASFPELRYARVVEARIARMAGIEGFKPVRVLPLLGTKQSYIVARRQTD
ncbi:MAG TPA: hypothetical protein VFQ61_32780, partial [Polyangiaceae bacterium]|nr:hypothetical protein [Polyangiaceae bacterium]